MEQGKTDDITANSEDVTLRCLEFVFAVTMCTRFINVNKSRWKFDVRSIRSYAREATCMGTLRRVSIVLVRLRM